MSILASRAVTTIPLLFDPPHTVTIQKLSGRHLRKADDAQDFAAQDYVKQMGGQEFRKQLAEATKGKTPEEIAQVTYDPVHNYDKHLVVLYGLKAWTYEEEIPAPADEAARKALIEDLEPDALEFIAREILRWTRPSLFQKEDAKASQKETDGASPVSKR
jgi:hypothetical protein